MAVLAGGARATRTRSTANAAASLRRRGFQRSARSPRASSSTSSTARSDRSRTSSSSSSACSPSGVASCAATRPMSSRSQPRSRTTLRRASATGCGGQTQRRHGERDARPERRLPDAGDADGLRLRRGSDVQHEHRRDRDLVVDRRLRPRGARGRRRAKRPAAARPEASRAEAARAGRGRAARRRTRRTCVRSRCSAPRTDRRPCATSGTSTAKSGRDAPRSDASHQASVPATSIFATSCRSPSARPDRAGKAGAEALDHDVRSTLLGGRAVLSVVSRSREGPPADAPRRPLDDAWATDSAAGGGRE